MSGRLLGHYRIIELLGKGGMGEVYLADDTRLGRRIAVKVLARELASDPDRRERFEREARAVAALNHPNIVTIHSVEEAEGVPFLTLELLEGRTLDSAIPADGMALDLLLAYAIPLADAVGTAHQRGITHRDLKPANVMITSDGRVKVLDFGLAKLKDDAVAFAGALPTEELTGEGGIVGTVAYMSPEQANGRPVDARSDVFSLGVMLFEMATGQRPFKGDTNVSVLSAILKDTPSSITELRTSLPRDLARIVKRCLNKDPDDRYQTAKDLRNDLRALRDDIASGEIAASVSGVRAGSPRAPNQWRARTTIAVAVAVALVAVAAAALYWRSTRTESTAASHAGPSFASTSLTRLATTGTPGLIAISPDGRYVAYVVNEDTKASLWLRQVATASNVAIVPPADIHLSSVTFSPDGEHLYYSMHSHSSLGEHSGDLYQVPVLGGGGRRVLDGVDGAVTFEPGGKRFAFVRELANGSETALIVADAQGNNPKTLVARKAPARFKTQSLGWSPDGRTIALLAPREGGLQVDVVLVDPAKGTETVVGNHAWRDITYVAWQPDARSLLINAQDAGEDATSQIWLMSVPDGDVRRITNDLTSYAGLSVAADGRGFVSVRSELRARIWIVDPAGTDTHAITIGAAADDGVRGLAWAPDGRLVYASASAGNSDIWIMDADGRNRVRLTSDPAHDLAPEVTSDGRRIMFVSERGGERAIWTMALDGGNERRVASAHLMSNQRFSPDGTWIHYTDIRSNKEFRIPLDGGDPVPVGALVPAASGHPLPQNFHEAVPSPDGKLLAGHYVDREQRAERIAVVPADGGPARLFPAMRVPVLWSPDSKSLVYQTTEHGATNLWRQPVAGGPPVQLTRFSDETIFRYSWSANQNRWAIVRGSTASDVVLVSDRR